jgi:hypothetical protein
MYNVHLREIRHKITANIPEALKEIPGRRITVTTSLNEVFHGSVENIKRVLNVR